MLAIARFFGVLTLLYCSDLDGSKWVYL